jgi:Leucine-rich repeat (LRR) protein
MLLVVVLLSITLVWVVKERDESRRRFASIEWVIDAEGSLDTDISENFGRSPFAFETWTRICFHRDQVVRVDLRQSRVVDLSPVSRFEELETLILSGLPVTDLSPLSGFGRLEHLDLSSTSVSDLSPLAGLSSLKSLDLSRTAAPDLSPLAGLTNLETLSICHTRASDLSSLAGLKRLRTLKLTGSHVSELLALSELTGLRSLDLTGVKVSRKRLRKLRSKLPECEITRSDYDFTHGNQCFRVLLGFAE